MSAESNASTEGIEIRTSFVRHRNALLAQGSFSELYVDYFLHLAQHGLHTADRHHELFKEALAALVLHGASRPRNELIAWTVHFEEPPLNVFLTTDGDEGTVAGRTFTENVRAMGANCFYSDVVRGTQPVRRSAVNFEGGGAFAAVEAFYRQSEQRPARFFDLGDEQYALVSAHPDCDLPWFESLTAAALRELPERETIVLLERRAYRWRCGCDERRIMQVLAPAMRTDPADLFGEGPTVEVLCPRCAARYRITREALEAYVARSAS